MSPVSVAMPAEGEIEPRRIAVIARGIAIVVAPIRPTTVVVATVPPAPPIVIVDGVCSTTGIYPNVLEGGYWSCRGGSGKHAKCECSRRERERPTEHVFVLLFWPA